MLIWPEKRGGRWSAEQFFETGRTDVHNMLLRLQSLGNRLNYGVALDFGCGVGRLTQALADEGFREVQGVDIAPSMIEAAEKLNRYA
ncbi:MAG: methyltransferase domain-containing protein, partial [Anaerolineae bacterium]|nr:methyltransferase domain-containing protein [Anaerolineae bacterium]NIN97443.1 methyltransferase domain-containing protein [Anaerolineae bacterium]NIQ80375.1 methyltransferase domain-containing protein [Anaerolineae bacterium]